MLLDRFEEDLSKLELAPHQHPVLLLLPFLAVLGREGLASEGRKERVENFLRTRLSFDSVQMRRARHFLEHPPNEETIESGIGLLEAMRATPDVVTIENRTIELVLFECEKELRRDEVESHESDSAQRRALAGLSKRLGIDLGKAWQDIAPEEFEEQKERAADDQTSDGTQGTASKHPPVRRWAAALRAEGGDDFESGGLI